MFRTSFRVSGNDFEPSHTMTFLQIYDKVRLKPVYSATETSLNL